MNLKKKLKRLLYGSLPGFAGSFPYFGTEVYFPPGSLIFEMACEEGIYEQANVDLLESLWKEGTYYFDIGANIGLMTVPLLRRKADCKAVSFEPSPNSLRYLERTVKASDLKSRWSLVPKALGKTSGEVEFHLSSPQDSAYEGFRYTGRYPSSTSITVPVSTLDEEWRILGEPAVSIIKIDVEGSELEVLAGGEALMEANHPSVLMEWNKQNIAPYGFTNKELLGFSMSHGYRVYSTPGLVPITDEAHLDLFCSISETFLLASDARIL